MNKTINLLLLSILTIALILLSGCIPQEQPTSTGTYKEMIFSPTEDITAKTFRTEEEYINFAKSHIGSTSFGGSYTNALGVVRTDVMMETADSISGGMEKSALSVQEFSETNNQVTGVDEADIIKTDGDYIYTISGNVLYIIKAYPGEEAEIIFTKEFDDSPTSLFINGDTMTVFGNMYNLDFFKDIDFRPSAGMTYFNIYDISDRSNPILEKEYKFEGNYFNARMVDDYVYFVTRSSPQFRTN
ncbi:MAG: beta-propeller domain-containing protein, partial [Candidatus Aenigmarchaeota archaeon]|nr:beta-propeller domain-containing protein [Candidatus Aenigmarchaeota archaeon]